MAKKDNDIIRAIHFRVDSDPRGSYAMLNLGINTAGQGSLTVTRHDGKNEERLSVVLSIGQRLRLAETLGKSEED